MAYFREWWEDPGNKQLGGRSPTQMRADRKLAKEHGSLKAMCESTEDAKNMRRKQDPDRPNMAKKLKEV